MTRYEIAFSGQLVEGAPLASVQANLARLFQADAQRIAQLFSGRRVVIKNNLDEVGAEKYRLTLERAGAVVEVLAMLVETYEKAHLPIELPDPIGFLEYVMDTRGLTRKDLEQYIGPRGRVADIMTRTRPLSVSMIRRLCAGLGLPADVLIQPYALRDAAAA